MRVFPAVPIEGTFTVGVEDMRSPPGEGTPEPSFGSGRVTDTDLGYAASLPSRRARLTTYRLLTVPRTCRGYVLPDCGMWSLSDRPAPVVDDRSTAGRTYSSLWLTMLITLPSGARTKNLRTPHASSVSG